MQPLRLTATGADAMIASSKSTEDNALTNKAEGAGRITYGARTNAGQMAGAALMTALLAVCSQIAVPLPLVPINLALLAVYLCALVLEGRWALISVGLYLLMGTVGLPVFAGFRGGPAALFGATGGYLLGYLCAAAVIVPLVPWADTLWRRALICALGLLACYVPGTLWLMLMTGKALPQVLPLAVYPFLPGDALKIAMAASLAPRLRAAMSRLR